MPYSELIKNFERIRDYMRDFYVYGFKSRTEYDRKSGRSYDNERRRMESWLGDYMSFRQTESGKNVFLAIDSRTSAHNPLYQAWKAKSFTGGDITLHFILFDILYDPAVCMSLREIQERIDRDYLASFDAPMSFDESTLRKKLGEYVSLGLLTAEKQGRSVLYRRSASHDLSAWTDAVSFFTEAGIAGVIGSYLIDRENEVLESCFQFKHHYITHALETDVLCLLFEAMSNKSAVVITNYSRRAGEEREWEVVPLKIFVSVQSGRRHLLCYNRRFRKTVSYRLDYITSVKLGQPCADFNELRTRLNEKQKHMWGVVCDDRNDPALEHVEFTLHIPDDEAHIWNRLEREKRCGSVTTVDAHTARFEADVYDTMEMVPWIRTFLCRITDLHFSNKAAEALFKDDFSAMCRLYGVGGEEA